MARSRCSRELRRWRLSSADAEDVVQESLVRAWRRLPTLDRPDRFEPWLLAICRNEALRRLGGARPEEELQEGLHEGPDDGLAAAEDRVDLRRTLSELPATDRQILWLRAVEDLAHRDVANVLGLTEGGVRVRMHRLRARLRDPRTSTE